MYTPCRKNKTQEFLNRINNKKRVGNIHSPNNSLTPWNRVLPATLIVTQLVKKYPPPPIYGTRSSLPCSQEPTNSEALRTIS